jgi:hypothetical protein
MKLTFEVKLPALALNDLPSAFRPKPRDLEGQQGDAKGVGGKPTDRKPADLEPDCAKPGSPFDRTRSNPQEGKPALMVTLDGISFDACKAKGSLSANPDISSEPETDSDRKAGDRGQPEACEAPKPRQMDVQELLKQLLSQLFGGGKSQDEDGGDPLQSPGAPKARGPQAHGPKGPHADAPKGPQLGDATSHPAPPKADAPKGPQLGDATSHPAPPKADAPKGPQLGDATSHPAPPKANAPSGKSPALAIDPNIKPTGPHGVETGLSDYSNYKKRLQAAMDATGVPKGDTERRAQIIAFSMMEGTKRDSSKDGTDSANGPLNMNGFLLHLAGEKGSSQELAKRMPTMSAEEAVKHLNKALDKHGLEGVMRAQRGGQTTFEDGGKSNLYAEFAQNFKFTLNALREDPKLQQDDRRVWTETPWVGAPGAQKPDDQ